MSLIPSLAFAAAEDTGWDGTTTTKPALKDGIWQIGTPEELAWFQDNAFTAEEATGAVLTADIDLNKQSLNQLKSPKTFDGQGHRIENLNMTFTSGDAGLFAAGTEIKNISDLTGTIAVSGSVANLGSFIGAAFSGSGSRSIKNCTSSLTITNKGTSSGTYYGGICGRYKGAVERCIFKGKINNTGSTSTSACSIGGIIGNQASDSGIKIIGCINKGEITARSNDYAGGIEGMRTQNSLESCYNIGTVQGERAGGICGAYGSFSTMACSGTTKNSYSAGQKADMDLYGYKNTSSDLATLITNSYYLSDKDSGNGRTEAVMKSDAFLEELNTGITEKDYKFVKDPNGGFPKLQWEVEAEAAAKDRADVDAAKAALTLEQAENITLPGSIQLPEEQNGCAIEWSSSNAEVITKDGAVTLPQDENAEVTLTAAITKGSVTATKEFTFQVHSIAEAKTKLQEKVQENCTTDILAYADETKPFDPKAVEGDFQLPDAQALGLDGQQYDMAIASSDENTIKIQDKTAKITRPQDADKDVTLTVTVTQKTLNVTADAKLNVTVAKQVQTKPTDEGDKTNPGDQTDPAGVKDPVKATDTENPTDPAKKDKTDTISTGAKKGSIVQDKKSNGSYVVTQTKQGGGTVTYKKPVNKKKASVTIPATVKVEGKTYKVTTVEKNAFKGNKQLKTVNIGSNVQSIGAGAFSSCTKLKTVKISSKVKTIQKNAFANCRNLKTITIQTKKLTKKTVGEGAFKGVNSKATVKVPKGKAKAYQKLLRSKGLNKNAKVK